MNITLILMILFFIITIITQLYTINQLGDINDRLPSVCGQFAGKGKYMKTIYGSENYITFSPNIVNSGTAFISLRSGNKTFSGIKWIYDTKDCSINIDMTDDLINYLKSSFDVTVSNILKFDNDNNLLVEVTFEGDKITLHIPESPSN